MNNRFERWRTVCSIIDFPSSRNTGSLGNINRHILDVTNVDISALHRALYLELGSDVANRFGKRLHCAFRDDSSLKQATSTAATVDAKWIITTFRAAVLAPATFHDPRGVFLKLVQDYHLECIDSCGDSNQRSILLSDVVRVASIAALSDEDVQSATVQVKKCIQGLTTSTVITMKKLREALELAALRNFRTQLLDKISDDKRLELLAGEEVSFVFCHCRLVEHVRYTSQMNLSSFAFFHICSSKRIKLCLPFYCSQTKCLVRNKEFFTKRKIFAERLPPGGWF